MKADATPSAGPAIENTKSLQIELSTAVGTFPDAGYRRQDEAGCFDCEPELTIKGKAFEMISICGVYDP
jgi:hypothetical protein